MTKQMQMTSPQALTRRHMLGKALGLGAVAVAASVVGKAISVGAQPAQRHATTAALNLRAGPSTRDKVILVMPKGATVYHMWDSKNGFYYVAYKDKLGWAHRDYLARIDPAIIGSAQPTANVNLRSGPSTGHRIIQVISQYASVSITAKVQNGYRYVYQHSGPPGWVSDAYLRRE